MTQDHTPDRTPEPPRIVLHESVHHSVAGLRRTLVVIALATPVLGILWGALGPGGPWGSAAVAVAATLVLVGLTWVTVSRAAAGPETLVAWIAGGYVAKVLVLAAALLGARAAGLDVRAIGICVVVAVVVTLGCEVRAFLGTRVPAVVPLPPAGASTDHPGES